MSAGWVAGSVRGRLLARRRLGAAGARAVAASGSTEAAVARLAASPYGRNVQVGMSAPAAGRAIGAVCLWHLRVLAGWLPPHAGEGVRVFAARYELENVADRVTALGGRPVDEPYILGSLAVAWPRIAGASSAAEVRAALAASPWGDPGTEDWPATAAALHARWTSWLATAVPDTAAWAGGAAAVIAAQLIADAQTVPRPARDDLCRQLGRSWERAADVADLAARVPRHAAWALDGIDTARDLWRAEGQWWRRVDHDAATMLRAGRAGPAVSAAAAARLSADAWRARAALEAAAWGAAGIEAFDAVA